LSIMSRIARLFRTPPPADTATEESQIGKRVLDTTIRRAEKTAERVERRSARDLQRGVRLVRVTDEVAEQLRRSWGN
jgi:hypothetical protein